MYAELYQPYKLKDSALNTTCNIFLENFGGPICSGPFAGEWLLPAEISETNDILIVKVEMPEVNIEEIEITIIGNALTIRLDKSLKNHPQSGLPDLVDENLGYLRFDVELPAAVKSDYSNAKLQKGILTVKMPKAAKPVEKKISVSSD